MSDIEIFGEEDLEAIEDDGNEERTEQPPDETPAEDEAPKVVKPKRVIRNPQPKLNAETLQGKRGLTALPSYFERVKFKGRGHEEEDLSVILKTYEYWCHRLFPKFPFDVCIEKIEQLGSKKKGVMTHVKKIRYDLINEETVLDNFDDDNDNVTNDAFDDLLPDPTPTQPRVEMTMTQEQLERIRMNKERAERIRQEKMRQRELEKSSQGGGSLFDEMMDQAESEVPGVSQKGDKILSSNGIFGGENSQSRRAIVDSDEDEQISQPTHETPNDSFSQTNDKRRLRIVDSDEESEALATKDEGPALSTDETPSNDQTNFDVEAQNTEMSQPTLDSFSQTNGRRRLRIVDSDEESEGSEAQAVQEEKPALSTDEGLSLNDQTSPSSDTGKQNRRRFRALIDSDED